MRKLHNFFIANPVISTFFTIGPTIFFILLRYNGEKWGFLTPGGSPTPKTISIIWWIVGVWFGYVVVKAIGDKRDRLVHENGLKVLKILWSNTNSVVGFKLEHLLQRFHQKEETTCHHILNPEEQIDKIIGNLQVSLTQIFDVDRDQVCISIVIFDEEIRKWKWLRHAGLETKKDANEVVTDLKSSFYNVAQDNRLLLYASKKNAIAKKVYSPSPRDAEFNNIGSICCVNISIGSNGEVVQQALLSISTYGKKFFHPLDKNARKKFMELIVVNFKHRLKYELAILALKNRIEK